MPKLVWVMLLGIALLSATMPTSAGAGPARRYTDAEIDGASASFKTEGDKFTGSEIRRLKSPIMLKPLSLIRSSGMVVFDLLVIVTEGRDSVLALQFRYDAGSWAFLDGSGAFLLDGERRLEVGNGDHPLIRPRRDAHRGMVRETVTIPISCETLVMLSAAHQVEVRLKGEQSSEELWFPKEALAAFRTLRIETGCLPPPRELPSQTRGAADSSKVD